jgi:two-component system cell cycle sensor histidine kinase/response regulator CckA
MKILIVDDNMVNLKLIRAQLEAEGHAVTQALDGVEALEWLAGHPVDAVISDILMPRMDGYRLCQEIRKHDRLRNLPTIIYSSTFTSPEDVKLALDVGADKYVSKPASIETIIASLHEVIAKPHAALKTGALPEIEVLKEYSQRLVDKLAEKKNALELANAELRTTRDQMAHLIKHSPAILYSLKVEGAQVIPQLVSENITRMLGFTAEEACSVDWWVKQLHPEDRERAIAGIPKVIKAGTWNSEYRIRHKAGHYLWMEDHQQLVRNAEGQPTDIVGVWTNITQRKQNENQVLRAQRLESIGTLACGVAHDLNNVLTPILMSTELLRLDCPDAGAESLDLIETSAKRGADMVKQLLTFARGAEGERLLVQTQTLLRELDKLISRSFPKRIELHTDFAKDLRPILGDATQLHQVLLNLCINARDAMPEGGVLTLKAVNAEIDAAAASAVVEARPGAYVALSITDTGTGIPSEILERIFEPFFTTKAPDKGTGLGLSTVSGIVKSHGGFLQVASVLGQGSTFTVYLPVAELPADEFWSKDIERGFRGHGQTVLVVDDDSAVRNFMRTLLAKLDFRVLTASDGTAALIQVAENQAHLRVVITDLNMPNMDGLTFARVLRAKVPHAGIIVVSGEMDESAAAEFEKLGAIAILIKPFKAEVLLAALEASLLAVNVPAAAALPSHSLTPFGIAAL